MMSRNSKPNEQSRAPRGPRVGISRGAAPRVGEPRGCVRPAWKAAAWLAGCRPDLDKSRLLLNPCSARTSNHLHSRHYPEHFTSIKLL